MDNFIESINLTWAPLNVIEIQTLISHDLVVRIVMSSIYGILGSVGLFGNIYVMNVIYKFWHSQSKSNSGMDTSVIFVVFLCLADLAVIITLPLMITFLVLQNWVFGPALCKLYWSFEV